MKQSKTLSCVLQTFLYLQLAVSTIQTFADDSVYDLLYNRPTHFPEWKQPNDWPVTMSYFTCARMGKNGDRLYNYEVAVYDQNNQLRHCGRSIADQNNLCTLTIPGSAGDLFHFKIIYGDFDHPTIVDVPETCRFVSNDNVGGMAKPFWLTIPVEAKVDYWLDSVSGKATGSYTAKEIVKGSASHLTDASRVKIAGDWSGYRINGLFKDCKNLLYAEFLDIPTITTGIFEGANPNCLIFIPEDEKTPLGWRNVIVGDKAATDIILSGGTNDSYQPFFCPRTVYLNGHQAVFTRPSWNWANGKSGWQTIVLPFDAVLQVDETQISPYRYNDDIDTRYMNNSILGYWLMSVNGASDDNGINTSFLYHIVGLTANQPYLLALPGDYFTQGNKTVSLQHKKVLFVSTADEIPATPDNLVNQNEDADTDYPFQGTYSVRLSTPMYLLKNKITKDGYDAFVKIVNGNILPFHAYFETTDASGATISGVSVREMNKSGIYIVDNKKIIK